MIPAFSVLASTAVKSIIEATEKLVNLINEVCNLALTEEEVNVPYQISLLFVDNNEIREINKDTRGIDKVTDVLSFPMLSDDFDIELEEESLGDIVISLERAFEQSKEYNHSFEREVCFLVCHSTFHLLGYDHDTEENTKQMREKEEYILNKLNITRE